MGERTAVILSAGSANKRLDDPGIELDALGRRGFRIEHYSINIGNLFSGLAYVARLSATRRPAVVIAWEYYCAFFACLTFGIRGNTKIFSFSLNQSRRLLQFGNSTINRLVNRIFGRLNIVVVHSQGEADQFSDVHDIPKNRFAFAHWGYDLPKYEPIADSSDNHPLACMIGRNNRDFEAFIEASNLAGFQGLIVAPAYSGLAEKPGSNIRVMFDISMNECIAQMDASDVNVVALMDDSRGAGHITMVSAMHLGKPQVVSEASQIADYVIDGYNGLVVPIGDVDRLAAAINRLLTDKILAERLGKNGQEIAARFMTHAAFVQRLNDIVEAALSDNPIAVIDPAWIEVLKTITDSAPIDA